VVMFLPGVSTLISPSVFLRLRLLPLLEMNDVSSSPWIKAN